MVVSASPSCRILKTPIFSKIVQKYSKHLKPEPFYHIHYSPDRSEIVTVVRCPFTVTITCIGKAPSGTAEAAKVLVSGLNFNQAGSTPPLTVATLIVASLPVAVLATCAGSGKVKPLPAVAISFGTETVMAPVD